MKKPKRKNPADDTGRNRRATRKTIEKLNTQITLLKGITEAQSLRLSRLELENQAEKVQLKKIMKYFQKYFTGRDNA